MNKANSLPSSFPRYPANIDETSRAVGPLTQTRRAPTSRRMSVRQMLAAFGSNIPAQTAILGVCDDSLPVLLDLTDDHPGPILVCGDENCGKTALMQSVLQTAISTNSSYEVKYAVIASNPEEWSSYDHSQAADNHCYSFHGYFENGASETIVRMAEIAEQRRVGREEGAAIMLMIDDLRFMAKADFDVRNNFEWLLKNGPSCQIWPIVSLSTAAALEMPRLVTNFRTRLIGHMEPGNTSRLSLFGGLAAECLEPGKQFAVRVQEQWLNFWIPTQD